MAQTGNIRTTGPARIRTNGAIFSNASTMSAVLTAYNAWEATQAADTTKTKTCRIVAAFFDNTMYTIVAEVSWPEVNATGGQVPEASVGT